MTTIDRRAFLHRLGGGLAAASLASLPLRAAIRQDRKLGWAIVGLGSYATRQIMPQFKNCRYSRIAALVSGTPEKARTLAAEYGVPQAGIYNYQNFDSIRNNPDVDIVYVVLPNSMHAEYTIRAARAGKHVITEKPMANTVRECEQMIAACRQAGKKLMVGYRSRFEPHNQEAIRIARAQELGPTDVIVADHGFNIGNPEQWRLKRALSGGGSLMDIGIYSLQAARYLTGEEPVAVTALEHTNRSDPRFREVEDTINFQLRFPSGVIANCVSTYTSPHNRYRLVGTRGWVELDPATSYSGQTMRVNVGNRTETRTPPNATQNQFVGQLDHFSECVLNNREPLVPGEEGLRDLRVMEAIYEAARTGRTIALG
ncbi:MAG: Gfo/Idh/MocA family oxidoreductase [Gemmatimonadetes bacterium]|nr:Gfo/Idh/MocA family oxidoreductase [Gemmatimonadota bacterium]